MITEQMLIDEAVSWIGTPFHHNQSCKGRGADCVGLCMGIYKNLGAMAADYFPPAYSQQWHMHQNAEVLIHVLNTHKFVKVEGEARVGDIYTFRFGRVTSHVGICVGEREFVHSYYALGRAVRQPLSGELAGRLSGVYRSEWMAN
ncbi:MAG: NlpC/P60 family protein [Burkholderiales bacterium]